jgi:hypothetical protein
MLAMNLKVKDVEICFLRSHGVQLTQSISLLSLPPSQEEAKKKGLVAVLEMTCTTSST